MEHLIANGQDDTPKGGLTMPKTDSTTERAPGGTSGADCSASELAELRKDKARLDWLESQDEVAVGSQGYGDYDHYAGDYWSKTVRELCDEQMQNAQGEHSPGATAGCDMLDPVVVPDFAPTPPLKKS